MRRLLFELFAADAVRFVPVELRRAGRAIVETDPSDPLALAPASRTVDPPKPCQFADPAALRDGLHFEHCANNDERLMNVNYSCS